MESETVKVFWIIFWILVATGWSVLSFQWLRKEVEEIRPAQILRRFVVFILLGLLIYLALRTEPLGAVGMVIAITFSTWIQVIIYNNRLNKSLDRKE